MIIVRVSNDGAGSENKYENASDEDTKVMVTKMIAVVVVVVVVFLVLVTAAADDDNDDDDDDDDDDEDDDNAIFKMLTMSTQIGCS
ncbi:hypothetical protein PoB_006518600 [Plakobranchus ocellatus]|uniref:Uncharacterized protein n=1 Tax=Plakobranchus ocellatus TaxID=259542 RepID=A0AAV4D3B4_9GAST|nr:hypothetical protein PoB_006518600 [Plakobranchus ocellatus]